MRRIFAAAICVLITPTIANAKPSPEIDQAKARIANLLKDPSSAQFKNVTYAPPPEGAKSGTVCGWVNAKNSYGGYVGFKPFYVSGRSAEMRDDLPDGSLNNHGIFDIMWNSCSPFSDESHGNSSLELPKLKVASGCERLYEDRPEKISNCVEIQLAAKAWVESYTTDAVTAYACAIKARKYGSYITAKSCVEEREATAVFSRGPEM